jgi:hypothetical protein
MFAGNILKPGPEVRAIATPYVPLRFGYEECTITHVLGRVADYNLFSDFVSFVVDSDTAGDIAAVDEWVLGFNIYGCGPKDESQ